MSNVKLLFILGLEVEFADEECYIIFCISEEQNTFVHREICSYNMQNVKCRSNDPLIKSANWEAI